MKKKWHSWDKWECIGMYTGTTDLAPDEAKQAYANFLKDSSRFETGLKRVLAEWPVSCEHFLTKEMNRVAWLGQASMSITTGIPRQYRAGFMLLTNDERSAANALAQQYLTIWEANYEAENHKVREAMAETWLF